MGMLPEKSEMQIDLESEVAKWDKTFRGRVFADENELFKAVKNDRRFVQKLNDSTMEGFEHKSLLSPVAKTYLVALNIYPTAYYNIAYECPQEKKIIGGAPKIIIRENTEPMQTYKGLDFECKQCSHKLRGWVKEIS